MKIVRKSARRVEMGYLKLKNEACDGAVKLKKQRPGLGGLCKVKSSLESGLSHFSPLSNGWEDLLANNQN